MNIVQLIVLTFVPGGFQSMKTPDKNKRLAGHERQVLFRFNRDLIFLPVIIWLQQYFHSQ